MIIKKTCYDEENEHRFYCDICDKIGKGRYYNDHPKSQTHIYNFRKTKQINNTKTNN